MLSGTAAESPLTDSGQQTIDSNNFLLVAAQH
jgi:hypothetical protein